MHSAQAGISSPFVAKVRDMPQTPVPPTEKEARKMFTVDNPGNLYIHGQLQKKI